MGDIAYFSECRMNASNIKAFYDKLPERLQRDFKESIAGKVDISEHITLKGYKGPRHLQNGRSELSSVLEEVTGVRIIQHLWQVSTDTSNPLGAGAVIGGLTMAGLRLAGLGVMSAVSLPLVIGASVVSAVAVAASKPEAKPVWCVLFFEEETGKYIGHEKGEVAAELYKKGCRLFNKADFDEAVYYLTMAFRLDSSKVDYRSKANKAIVESDAATLNETGERLFDEGEFLEAKRMYERAVDKSDVPLAYNQYRRNMAKASGEINAAAYSAKGDELFNIQNYSGALKNYRCAYDTSQLAKCKIEYSNRLKITESALEIETMWNEANSKAIFSESAYIAFRAVLDKSEEYASKFEDSGLRNHYQELSALIVEGTELYNHGKDFAMKARDFVREDKFYEANVNIQKARWILSAAIDKFKCGSAKNVWFLAFVASVQKRIQSLPDDTTMAHRESEFLNKQGDQLFEGGQFQKAHKKYEEAFVKSVGGENYEEYKVNVIKSRVEMNAVALNNEGHEFYKNGDFTSALAKFKSAFDSSNIAKQKVLYDGNLRKTVAVINHIAQLETTWQEAWDAENDREIDRSDIAETKFSQVPKESKNCADNYQDVEKFREFYKLATLKREGDDLFNDGLAFQKIARENGEACKFDIADKNLKDAEEKYKAAKAKYDMANCSNFSSAIEFVEHQLKSLEEYGAKILAKKMESLNVNVDIENNHNSSHDIQTARVIDDVSANTTTFYLQGS